MKLWFSSTDEDSVAYTYGGGLIILLCVPVMQVFGDVGFRLADRLIGVLQKVTLTQ